MSRLLLAIHRRLDLLQRRLWVKIALSVLAVAVCASYFGVLMVKTNSLLSQQTALYEALKDQNLTKRDPNAVSLNDSGEVVVNGRTYGGPAFKNPRVPWFDEQGNITALRSLVASLLADQVPSWAPRWLLESSGTTQWLGLTVLALL